MSTTRIALGAEDRVALLYSYPNVPDAPGSLAATVVRYFSQTLRRDGLAAMGATCSVRVEGPDYAPFYFLELDGPVELAGAFNEYAIRLPQYLNHGWDALTQVIPMLKAKGLWDPMVPKPPSYRPWRFYMPHGLPMIRQRALQFFHYPPIRLLERFQDYLYDPVPFRVEELLMANGVATRAESQLFESVMDATPIAAADDQGSLVDPHGDKEMGLIPIQHFPEYQKAQVRLLLNPCPTNEYFTIPIVVYGSHPGQIFNRLYGTDIGIGKDGNKGPTTVEIIPGKKTPVLGSSHPYRFYATAQITKDKNGKLLTDVGLGSIVPENCEAAVKVMRQDLAVARWSMLMADDPSQDPKDVFKASTAYWADPERDAEICALTKHEGSLRYPDAKSLDFRFDVTMSGAQAICKLIGDDPCAAVPVIRSGSPTPAPSTPAKPSSKAKK